jgi:hypothetical protein
MGCNCGAGKVTYTVTAPNGSVYERKTEVEAAALADRIGGTWAKKA